MVGDIMDSSHPGKKIFALDRDAARFQWIASTALVDAPLHPLLRHLIAYTAKGTDFP